MNLAIIGVGGVGGYFGAKICNAKAALGANVYFVARGPHLRAIEERGLTVRTSSEGVMSCRPTLVTDRIEDLPPLDGCLVCVKSFDLEGVARRLEARLSEKAEVVPLLNGIDIHDRLREHVRRAAIFPACVFVGTHIAEPGVVSQDGGACKVLFGPAPHGGGARSVLMTCVFEASGVKHEWHNDITSSIWTKFVFIASFGLVTACFGKTLGQVMESPELSSRAHSIMTEIVCLAAAQGVVLPPSIIEDSCRKGNDFPPDTRTSFQRDFELRDRPDERDLFGGTIIRLGRQLGVPTPSTKEIDALINHEKAMPRAR